MDSTMKSAEIDNKEELDANLEKCIMLQKKLKECNETHTFGKFLGYCSDANTELVRCLKKQYEMEREAKMERSRQIQERRAARLKLQAKKGVEPKIQ